MGNHWFPEGCGVLVVTQDGTLDLADVSWQRIAPCGCVSGVSMAAVSDQILATAEHAVSAFCENAAERERDREQGFTYRPREHRAAVEEMQTNCPHDPEWGYEKPPEPEGYVWAAVHQLGSRPKLTHLVAVAAVERAKKREVSAGHAKPLCGGKGAFWWKDEWYATDGKVECKRCIAAAHKMAEAVA
jgi:hypothetical protein